MATDEIPLRIETAVLPQQYSCEMTATKFTADGLSSTKESDPINEDTKMDTKITYEEEDALLSEDRDKDIGFRNDSIPNAQRQERQRDTTNEPKSRKRPSEEKTKEPTGSENTSNDSDRKRRREEPLKSAKTNGSSDRKRSQHEELISIQKIERTTNSISLLNNHLEKGSCPKTLRYNARANITSDEDFKKDINSIRKKAEQALVGALVKFHYRRVDRLKNKYRKLEQAQSCRSF